MELEVESDSFWMTDEIGFRVNNVLVMFYVLINCLFFVSPVTLKVNGIKFKSPLEKKMVGGFSLKNIFC